MKVCRVFVMAISVLFLYGCAEIPEDISQEMENQNSQGNVEVKKNENISEKYLSVKEIAEKTPSTWKSENDIFRFDGVIQVPDVEELYMWKVEVANKVYQKSEETREMFLKHFDNLSIKQVDENKETFTGSVAFYDDEEIKDPDGQTDKLTVSAPGGFYLGMSMYYWRDPDEGQRWLWMPMEGFPYEEQYFFDMNGKCIKGGTDTWRLYDGREAEVQKTMDRFMEVLRDYQKIETDMTFVPDRLSVCKNEPENCYFFSMHAAQVYDGVKVDDSMVTDQPIRDFGNRCRLATTAYQIEHGVGDFPYWTHMQSAYKESEKIETYKKIIPFEEAWKILEGKVADQIDIQIHRADLVYSIWYEPEGDTDIYWYIQMDAPPEMYAAPVWRFLSYKDGQASYAYYVDAVTGEVTAYDHAVLN